MFLRRICSSTAYLYLIDCATIVLGEAAMPARCKCKGDRSISTTIALSPSNRRTKTTKGAPLLLLLLLLLPLLVLLLLPLSPQIKLSLNSTLVRSPPFPFKFTALSNRSGISQYKAARRLSCFGVGCTCYFSHTGPK